MVRKSNEILRSEVAKWWYENKQETLFKECGYLMDIGEPSCWACNMFYKTTPTYTYKKYKDNVFAVWDGATFLQICHIIPKSLGGSDNLENLFLLCPECHDRLPDTVYPEIFYKAVMLEPNKFFKYDCFEMKRLTEKYNIKEDFLEEMNKVISSEEFQKWMKDKCGMHWFQGNMRGSGIKIETVMALAIYYINNAKV